MADIIAKFKGTAPGPDEPGSFRHGIPARHLTAEDWSLLDNEQRQLVRASSLYDYSGKAKAAATEESGK